MHTPAHAGGVVMLVAWFRNSLTRYFQHSENIKRKSRPRRTALPCRRTLLGVEPLENRLTPTSLTVGPNINITKSAASDAESAIAVNPTNTKNLFMTCTADRKS